MLSRYTGGRCADAAHTHKQSCLAILNPMSLSDLNFVIALDSANDGKVGGVLEESGNVLEAEHHAPEKSQEENPDIMIVAEC